MSKYSLNRRAQRGHPEFVIGPAVSARYAKPRNSYMQAIALVLPWVLLLLVGVLALVLLLRSLS